MLECTCTRCCYARKHPQFGPAPHRGEGLDLDLLERAALCQDEDETFSPRVVLELIALARRGGA